METVTSTVAQEVDAASGGYQRLGVERRQNIAKTALYACFRQRRRAPRRTSDSTVGYYQDWHERELFVVALGLLLFCILDAFLTTALLLNGSRELNPLLNYLLQQDLSWFLVVKFGITGAGIGFLVLHRNHRLFNRFTGAQLLSFCFWVYFVLMLYQISMVWHLSLF